MFLKPTDFRLANRTYHETQYTMVSLSFKNSYSVQQSSKKLTEPKTKRVSKKTVVELDSLPVSPKCGPR